MSFSIVDDIFTISLDMLNTTALATIVLLIGVFLRYKVKFFYKYCIPAPVVGGFIFMIITCIGYMTNTFNFQFDVTFESIFMVAFFTTVGLSADFALIKKGGKLLLIYWACAGFIALVQGPVALGVGNLLGMENAYSILAGAISMSGGHGGATAYGATLESMGYANAQAAGIAAATFGLITSVLLGGPLARRLITKYKLKSPRTDTNLITADDVKELKKRTPADVLRNMAVLIICMALGVNLSNLISAAVGMTVPEYLGAMVVSIIVRNLNEKLHFFKYDAYIFEGVGNVSLALFLSIAMMSIKLWELLGLVGGIAIIVVVQVIIMGFYVYFIVFKALGKSYDAAVMCAGMCGHALGATPTAMANMEAVSEEYGVSHQAYLIVPIVAAFLVEIIYQPFTLFLVNACCPVIS